MKRIKEINNTEPYKSYGPWTLGDFRQVNDWRKVEYNLHYIFRSKLNKEIGGQKELFLVSLYEASQKLNEINPEEIIRKPKVDRLFQDELFYEYIRNLFKFTGLLNWLDIQGAWTFVLFPSTNGGRYFTINIGPHEVAYSTLKTKSKEQINMIVMDKLIFDFDDVKRWIKQHDGSMDVDAYDKALPRSVAVQFNGDFNLCNDFMKLDGVRRAIIAYWFEGLMRLKENDKMSSYAQYHNYNAIAKLNNKMKELER